MGPQPDIIQASAPPIDLNRFLGPCLISKYQKRNRQISRVVDGNDDNQSLTGAPLLSLQGPPKSDGSDESLPDMSKLALHAQGAPLIISQGRPFLVRGPYESEYCDEQALFFDQYVPRIIKPRKRRKKDKKGFGLQMVGNQMVVGNGYPYPPSDYCRCCRCDPSSSKLGMPCQLRRCKSKQEIPHFGTPGHSGHLEMKYFLCRSKSWPPVLTSSPLSNRLYVNTEHPPQRPWIPLTDPDKTQPTSIFTVMSYNVLCDKYATRQLYGHCPNWALSWEYRKKGILDEIRHYSADIISLQEVETDQFYNFFMPELKQDGYDGIFSPKSRAKTMSENDRKFVDGCAIFFRTNKFSLIKEHLFEFNQLAMANAEGSDDMLNRVMTKDNIGLAALLETKSAAWTNGIPDPMNVRQPLLVCTAHIHWDPEYCDVKLIQTMMLMKELRTIIDEEVQHNFRPGAKKPNGASMPIVLCGDLNSLPKSGVCDLMMQGRISADHEDFKGIGYKDCLRKLAYNDTSNEYTHSLNLASVYNSEVMPYTNYTFDFKGIIDYIFYQKEYMNPLGLLGPLDVQWMKENKIIGCPHPHIPSDHFPLLCELELLQCTNTSMHNNGLIIRR